MLRITLPDGTSRTFDHPVTAGEVAASIGSGLAKAALGARVDGELVDLSRPLDRDCRIEIVTAKPRSPQAGGAGGGGGSGGSGRSGGTGVSPVEHGSESRATMTVNPDALFLIRHSAAHVLAEAIQHFYPRAQLVYGPPVENGFFYDIAFPEGQTLSSEDFEKIEVKMREIIAEDRPFTRSEKPAVEGMEKLHGEGSKYKIDNAERALAAGASELSWYATGTPGENWEDLCRGPHVPSTGRIGAVKIMSLASSYWHGDENSDRLTRVYGTAFPTQKELDAYLEQLEQAKERDHRVLGKKLGLFHIDEMVGQGLILWKPKGAIVRRELEQFIGEELRRQGYETVYTPHIGKLDLYRTSGHFPYYQDSQYPPLVDRETLKKLADERCTCADLSNRMKEGEIDGYLLKPMNCPHHIRIFASEPRSYRDMPVRLAEFGTVYRWEQSGEIGGMTRVRGFTQDDAHLFCTEDQVPDEVQGCLSIVKLIFRALNMTDYRVRVGLRDPDSSKYVGDPANWDKAEAACRAAAASLGVPFSEEPGEAAFYGPKIDFIVRDVIGREWQLGTVQVDYNLPVRFDLSYTGPDNAPHRPVMIHRAPFGSMERFVGVLIEHFAGAFPTWLAPEQARVLPISEKSSEYACEVSETLKREGVRSTVDDSNERIQAKIRTGAGEKIPYLLVVGPRDAQGREVSIRARGVQHDLGAMGLDDCVAALLEEIQTRGRKTLLSGMAGPSAQ